MTVTAAAPQSTDGARSEPPSRVAPSMTMAAPKPAEAAPKPAEAAPKFAETARAEVTAPVASESAAPEATENVAPAPKKPKKTARKTPRHERQRDFNPMNFFAWGGNNGWRRF
jgi:hypothetical protein